MTPTALVLGYVPGATPAKWARIWAQRHPEVPLQLHPLAAAEAASAVREGTVDVALLRLPADTSQLCVIGLYEEQTVAVVPADHLLSAFEEVRAADLDDEPTLIPLDDVLAWSDAPGAPDAHRPDTTKGALALVAAGMGMLIVPQSLARLYHRKDLIYRPITDAPLSPVAIAYRQGQQTGLIEDFVGIVRGRTAGSSRGRSEPTPKRTARQKTLAKQANRAVAGRTARQSGRPRR